MLMGPEVFSKTILLEDKSKFLLAPIIFFDEGFEWRFKVGMKDRREEVLFWNIIEVVLNLEVVSIREWGIKVSEQDEANEEEVFSFETKVEGLHVLK